MHTTHTTLSKGNGPNIKNKKFGVSRWVTGIALFLGAVLAVEGFLRWNKNSYEELKDQHYPLIYRPDNVRGYSFVGGATARVVKPWVDKTATILPNGFTGRRVVELSDSTRFKIVLMGQSTCTNIWTESAWSYPDLLTAELDKKGYRVDLLNVTTDGNARDLPNVNFLYHRIDALRPDLVFFKPELPFAVKKVARDTYRGFVIEYRQHNAAARKQCTGIVDAIHEHKFFFFLYDHFFIVRKWVKWWADSPNTFFKAQCKTYREKICRDPGIQTSYLTVAQSLDALGALDNFLRQRGIALVLYNKDAPVYREARKQTPIPFLLLPFDEDKYVDKRNNYINAAGHQAAAALFYDQIINQRLIPGKFKTTHP